MQLIQTYSRSHSENIPVPTGDFALISKPGSNEIFYFENGDNSNPIVSFRCHPFKSENNKKDADMSREQHREIILKALEEMQNHNFAKVVVSRTKQISISKTRSEWMYVFRILCNRYPTACINWFSHGNEMWMGATPELLLSKKGGKWHTVSISGTQPFDTAIPLENHAWKDKEIREQAIVTEYITRVLQQAGAANVIASAPYNLNAGSLVHIKTEITFEFVGDTSHILQALHPTPAVCGFPLKESLDFILTHEPHSRELYAGYFGMLQDNGDADYFVNLRCMRILPDHLTLYAGGGIVPGSDPEKEWEETEKKMEVMLSVVQSA
ncbi:MAG: chorismate-binding protein [Flavobacteriales bacterium]